MIDSEFVQKIADIAVQGAHAHAAIMPNDARKVLLTTPKGEVQIVDTPVPLVAVMDRIDSVYSWAEQYDGIEGAAIFLSPSALTLIASVSDRRERVTCPLVKSAHCARLSSPFSVSQDEFIQILRLEFAERIDVNVIEKVKAIRFRKEESGEAAVGHQAANATIGKSVQIEAVSGGVIPELIPVMVQPFKCHEFQTEVTCAVVIDLEKRKFGLLPIAEEMDGMFVQAMDAIASEKSGSHPPLYFGSVNN